MGAPLAERAGPAPQIGTALCGVGPVTSRTMLDENIKSLAQAKNFAAFTTLLPSGQPMTHVMWVDADDEHILINTEVGRQKALQRQ